MRVVVDTNVLVRRSSDPRARWGLCFCTFAGETTPLLTTISFFMRLK